MTTPAINTPLSVINEAFENAGLLQSGQPANSEQLAKGLRKLREVINFAQTKGLRLWLNVDTAVPLVAGQATYTFTPGGNVNMTKPLRVLQGYVLTNSGTVRRPIWPISWNEWLMLSNIDSTNPGTISQYFVDKQTTQLSVTFWSTPSVIEAMNVAHLLLQVQVTNPISLTEDIQFPEEWGIWLGWAVAAEICTGQPQSVIDRCEGKAALYLEALDGWDVEDAETQFTPDYRQQYSGSRFR